MTNKKKDFLPGIEETKTISNEYINGLLGTVRDEDREELSNITDETGEVMTVAEVKERLIDNATHYKERKTYGKRATREALATMKTQGKKGIKLPRINMAFTPENYNYIKTMAAVNGSSLSEYLNTIITKDLQANKKLYNKVLHIQDDLNS